MGATERLYSPELLALTLELAGFPWAENFLYTGDARSKTCGSTLRLGFDLDDTGRIGRIGMKVQACAVGQAAAAIFANAATGRSAAEITAATAEMSAWLAGGSVIPKWPGIGQIQPARSFPGRHGAMMLAWQAAIAALSSAQTSR